MRKAACLAALLLPALLLAGCGGTPPSESPLSPAAMKAIAQIHKLTGVQGVALAYP